MTSMVRKSSSVPRMAAKRPWEEGGLYLKVGIFLWKENDSGCGFFLFKPPQLFRLIAWFPDKLLKIPKHM